MSLSLYCVILASSMNLFPIDLKEKDNRINTVDYNIDKITFGHLKKIICQEKPNFFNKVEADTLTLWKVEDLSDKGEKWELLKNNTKINIEEELGGKMLSPIRKVRTVFPDDPLEDRIHIIIQSPIVPPSPVVTGMAKIKIDDVFPNGLKYADPLPLVTTLGQEWDYQLDPDLKEKLRKHTEVHYNSFKKQKKNILSRPTYFFFSGAGTGKSRNASEFHNTLIESLEGLDDLQGMIKKAWVFNISLENNTSYNTSFNKNVELYDILAIGIRMLWQVVVNAGDFNYKGFYHFLNTYEAPTPFQVIDLIAKGHNKTREEMKQIPIILVIDGLQLFMTSYSDGLDKESAFYQNLSSISDLGLSNNFFLIPCCTATITRPFDQTIKASTRLRILLPVPSLNPPTFYRNGKTIEVFQNNYLMNLLVSDCGGHGRALEALAELIGDKDIKECNINKLMNDLRYSLELCYPNIFNISSLEAQAVARVVLTRTRLDSRRVIPGTDKLPDYFEQSGLIRFEKINSVEGYLKVPYIWMWIMAQPSIKGEDPLLRNWLFCDYNEHSAIFDQKRLPGSQFWNHFEHFIPNFRCLKSKVLKENEKMKISEIHAGARLHLKDDFEFTNHHLKLEHAKHQEITNSSEHSKTYIMCEDLKVKVREGKYCVINGAGAQYGDSFLGLDLSRMNNVINPHEIHQTKKWKTTNVTKEIYYNERKKCAGDKDFFILYTTGYSDNFVLPENSGIVDKTNWNDYFGPFASRAFNYAIKGALDINNATTSELMTIDGIGEARAGYIITERNKRKFESVEDVHKRTGIDIKVVKKLKSIKST